jgi:hypothetical protein
MEKLFSDSELFQKERPTKITEEQKKLFCTNVAKHIVKNGWSKNAIENVTEDISILDINTNGYEIAKELESDGRCCYNIDLMFVEYLDDLYGEKSQLLRANVKEWAAAHNPIPKFLQNDKLVVNKNYKRAVLAEGAVVTIHRIDKEEACYIVNVDPKENGGFVIPYEIVEAHCILL